MSDRTMFSIEIAVVAVLFAIHIARLSRKGMLSFRYSVGWISIAIIGLLASPLVIVVAPLANRLRLTPAALLIAISTVAVAVILIQLSVSISGNQRSMESLVRENALLKEKLNITLREHQSDSTD